MSADKDSSSELKSEVGLIESEDGSAVFHDPSTDEPLKDKSHVSIDKTKDTVGDEEDVLHDDEDDDDSIAVEGETTAVDDDERKRIQVRRKAQREAKKASTRRREQSLRSELGKRDKELEELRGAVNALQRRGAGAELAQLDDEIARTEASSADLRAAIAEGTTHQNGAVVAEATDRLVKTNQRATELARIKANFVDGQRRAAQPREQTQPAADPRVRELGQNWHKSHQWYRHGETDTDSRVMREIDRAVHEEGFDPKKQEYWDELSSRVEKYLPHRVAQTQNTEHTTQSLPRKTVGTVVSGSGRESSSGTNGAAQRGSGFVLDKNRVKALRDMGYLDELNNIVDPKAMASMVKRYKEYDKAKSLEK